MDFESRVFNHGWFKKIDAKKRIDSIIKDIHEEVPFDEIIKKNKISQKLFFRIIKKGVKDVKENFNTLESHLVKHLVAKLYFEDLCGWKEK